jgi:hypothetical protein
MNTTSNLAKSATTARQENWIGIESRQVAWLRFDVGQVVVRDSRVEQVERTETVQLDQRPTGINQTPTGNPEA